MTNERICTMIQAEPDDCRELLPILWEKVRRLLFKIAGDYYAQHVETCTRCGVEAGDLRGICYEVFLSTVDAYKPDGGASFTSYFGFTFKNHAAELLGIRTERGRREPLNNCDSLDRPIDAEDADGATLGDFIADPSSSDLESDVLGAMNREQEAEAVRAAVDALPDVQRCVISLLFWDGLSLKAAGERLNITGEMVRQYRRKALQSLRRSPMLREMYREAMRHEQAAESRNQYRPDRAAILRAVCCTDPRQQRQAAPEPNSSDTVSNYLNDTPGQVTSYLTKPNKPARPETLREWAERERQRRAALHPAGAEQPTEGNGRRFLWVSGQQVQAG